MNQVTRPAGRRPLWAVSVAIFSLLTLPSVYAQSEVVIKGVRISSIPQASGGGHSLHGYVEHRFRVINQSDKARNVSIRLPGQSYSTNGHHVQSLTKGVRLEPLTQAILSLPQPPLNMPGSAASATVDGQTKPLNARLPDHVERHHSSRNATALVSKSVPSRAKTEVNRIRGTVFTIETNPTLWSENWLGYTRYDAVVVSDSDMTSARPAARQALTRYVSAGGTLLVVGESWTPPESWGELRKDVQSNLRVINKGFGVCFVGTAEDASKRDPMRPFVDQANSTGKRWKSRRSVSQAHGSFRVVEDLRIPVRGLLSIMVLFSILIGPV
ncbi:MAG: hypothetical protein AAF488_16895, partial [Planctomycetota bacterium]